MPTSATSYRPENMQPVTPHLVCRGAAEAIDFYVRAFAAVENGRMAGPDGKLVNAMITLQGGTIMLVDENMMFSLKGTQTLGGSAIDQAAADCLMNAVLKIKKLGIATPQAAVRG